MKTDLIFTHNELSKAKDLELYSLSNSEQPFRYLNNFSQINVIIGANNSGKSKFIRSFLHFSFGYKYFSYLQYIELINQYNIEVNKLSASLKTFIDTYYTNGGRIPDIRDAKSMVTLYTSISLKHIQTEEYNSEKTISYNDKQLEKILNHDLDFIKEYNSFINDFNSKFQAEVIVKFPKRYFIPTLRTAHSLFLDSKKIEKDIYADTLDLYYKINQHDLRVFTGLDLYKEILKTRNSDKQTRNMFEKFEDFLSKYFFNGKKIDIVANFDIDVRNAGKSESELILIHVEDEKHTRKLHDLGDGIQAIIILMYQVFMAEPNSMIFIDEPELHLHPGMQRLFLEQLCRNEDLKKKNLTYFITTHSNHFLDLTIEKDNVSIYSFSSQLQDNGEKKFIIKNVNAGDNEILQNLGVNNSSVFMANCSIWVEGVSDRNYIKAFLKAYMDHLFGDDQTKFKSVKEDIDYAFFEYAGSNIEHYFFGDLEGEEENEIIDGINAMALNNRILLLADSDNVQEGSPKRNRLDKLKQQKDENFIPVIIEDVREIENLLTNDIWDEVLIKFCNKKLVSKHENEIKQKISSALKEIHAVNYQAEYIGEFLNKINRKLKDIDRTNILNESIYEHKTKTKFGTFILKRELSELVLKADFPWEVFEKNPRIVQLTESIYNFITKRMQ